MKAPINLSFLKHLSLKRDGHFLGFNAGADADWQIIFSFLATFIIIALGAGLYLFVKINRGELFVADKDSGTEVPTLNTTFLNRTVTYYDTKGKTLENVEKAREVVVDPSR